MPTGMGTCPTCRTRFEDPTAVCPHDGADLLPDEAFLSADNPVAPGTLVGEYRVEALVAEGGFGTVYRCVHPVIGKSAALKVLKREFSANPEMVARFISEARAVNQIRHRNIVDIFSFGVLPDGRHYYVMELLEGVTLDRLVQERGRLGPLEALPIIRQLGRALGAAHAAGITHRDIKPENVFLVYDEDGVPTAKLLDFGIAKLVDTAQSAQVTRPGAPMGTPLYMSPEQVYARGVDHRSDIYSFGVLVHEVLTGAPPFDGDTVMDVLTAQTTAAPPPASSLVPSLPAELDAPILQMLEKDPAKRPQSITVAIDRLLAAAERGGIVPVASRSGRQVAETLAVGAAGPASARRSSPGRGSSVSPSVASTLPRMDSHARGVSRSVLALGGVVVAGALVAAAVLATRSRAAQPSQAPPSAATPSAVLAAADAPRSAAPPPATATASAAQSPTVQVTFEGAPRDAEVTLDGRTWSEAGLGLPIPRGTEKVKLTLRSAGFLPKEVFIVPDRDRSLMVELSRPNARPRPSGGKADLEF